MGSTDRTLIDVVQRHARLFPDRRLYTYLADGESESGTLTYGELDAAARAVAAALLQIAEPGDRAVLLYPVGLEYLVGFFGCLYAGIVAVPAYPLRAESRSGGRIRTMIADCRPRLALTCQRLAARVEQAIGELDREPSIRVFATDEGIDQTRAAGFEPRVTPDMLAFLQYTSASVAEAKGVRVTHANLIANQEMIRHAMAHDEHSDFVSWLPPYHDMGLVGNLLQPPYLGASCAFMPPTAFVQEPLRWLSAISKYRARTSGAPNFAYALCIKKIAPEQHPALDLSSWTVAYCGAEAVDANVAERFAAHFAPWKFRKASFYPCYGLAEATLMASGVDAQRWPDIIEIQPDLLEKGRLQESAAGCGRRIVSCGTATQGTAIAIVDPESGRALPEAQVGEIWITGAHVAAGYWNRPDASRDVFEARIESDDARYLRTGDLGAFLRGQLYVVGRIKETIVHAGRNLYPTDIESIVEASAGDAIDVCAAFAVPGEHTEDVAVVMEAGRRGIDAGGAERVGEAVAWDLYRALEVWPVRLVFVGKGAIPRTSSGKKQRLLCGRMLARGKFEILAEWQAGAQSRTSTGDGADDGAWLANLVSRLTGLPIERVLDQSDGASAWSLDSLMAVEIVHQIQRRRGVTLPIALFYEPTSLGALVQEIERRDAERRDVARQDAAQRDAARRGTAQRDPARPPSGETTADDAEQMDVTPGQEAVWFSQQVDPSSPAFHIKWALRVTGGLDPDRLRESIRTAVARHDVLRSTFHLSADGRLGARLLPADRVDYECVNLPDEALVDWVDRECEQPFRLDADLLVRVRHGRGSRSDVVAFSLHHLIGDLWSCALFTEEVLEHYATGACMERPRSFRLYARHVREIEAHGGAAAQYWRSRLDNAPPRDPVDALLGSRSRPAVRSYEGGSVSTAFERETSQAVLERARERRVSRQVLLLSAYGVWLWHLTGLEDFLTGCLTSGRSRADFSRVQGLLANPFAVRFHVSSTTTVADVVSGVREQVLRALDYEDYPFQAVVRDLKLAPSLGRTPLFQNMFVYQQLPAASKLAGCVLGGGSQAAFVHRGMEIQCVPLPQRSARYDFTLYCMDVESRLVCEAVYATELFDRPQVTDILGRFATLVRRVVTLPADTPVSQLARELEMAC